MNRRIDLRSFLALALLGPAAGRAERKMEVDVVVDLAAAGRRAEPPSPGHPVYYFPVVGGYQALGAALAGEPTPPPAKDVVHLVAVELAKQGYLVTQARQENGKVVYSPDPALVIAVHWGSLNPVIEYVDRADDSTKFVMNESQMLALVGGDTLKNLDLNFEREGVKQAAAQDRYFVVLTAFDLHAYQKTHKRVQLWQAKMSVAATGVTLAQVVPALVKAGGPMFGRATKRPQMLIAPITPEGRVEIGTPTVKDYQDVPLPPPKPPAKAP